MNEQIKEYLDRYPDDIRQLYERLRQLIYAGSSCEPVETLWAKLPSYYVGDSFVRLIPFKDHINVEASVILQHQAELTGYKITPKGMLQIFLKQEIPEEILTRIFKETLA